jgi:hypothetical protein
MSFFILTFGEIISYNLRNDSEKMWNKNPKTTTNPTTTLNPPKHHS